MQIDQKIDYIEFPGEDFDAIQAFYEKAFGLLTSEATHRAFDLASEPTVMRKRYGRNQVGQSCLLARRLVEAGVPFVNVHWCKTPSGSWDTHGQNFKKMKETLGPTLDTAFSGRSKSMRTVRGGK